MYLSKKMMVKYEYFDLNGSVELLSKDKIYDYKYLNVTSIICENSLTLLL